MKILMVAATGDEIGPLIKKVSVKAGTKTLKTCRYKRIDLDILITGAGMVSTAYYCAKTISNGYDCVINPGIAGSFKRDIPIGAVTNVICDQFPELGAESGNKFLSLKDLGLHGIYEIDRFPSIKNRVIASLAKVKGITVNTVHGNRNSIKKIRRKFNPDIETMEGAAFLFACKQERIPCAQIRAISNFVEVRNKENWNVPLAIKNLNQKIEEILENF